MKGLSAGTHAGITTIPKSTWTFLFLLAFLLCTKYFVEQLFGFTDEQALIDYLKNLVRTYGYAFSFMGAFLEGLLLIGVYFPGSFIIFLTVIVAETPQEGVMAVLVVTTALYLAYAINFVLGKYGWYKLLTKYGLTGMLDDAREKLARHQTKAICMSYWNPGLASFTATAAGVLHLSAWFYFPTSFVVLLLWNSFWGALAYTFRDAVMSMLFSWYFLVVFAAVYVAATWYEERTHAKNNQEIRY